MCCAFGHRELYASIEKELGETLTDLIDNKNVTVFLTGGTGATDGVFSATVRKLKNTYPDIKLVLVKPYFLNKLNSDKEYYEMMYDAVIIPEELAECHYKSAITKRNKWIVDRCEFIIDCTYRDFGGAVDAIKYAKRKGKSVIKLKNSFL